MTSIWLVAHTSEANVEFDVPPWVVKCIWRWTSPGFRLFLLALPKAPFPQGCDSPNVPITQVPKVEQLKKRLKVNLIMIRASGPFIHQIPQILHTVYTSPSWTPTSSLLRTVELSHLAVLARVPERASRILGDRRIVPSHISEVGRDYTREAGAATITTLTLPHAITTERTWLGPST